MRQYFIDIGDNNINVTTCFENLSCVVLEIREGYYVGGKFVMLLAIFYNP